MDQDQGQTGQTQDKKKTQSGKKPITDAHREKIRRFFLPYLFPVSGKSLCVAGHSWKFEAKKHIAPPFLYDGKNKPPPNPTKDDTKKLLIRSAPGYKGREGLDMGHARLVGVDLDTYKKEFQNPHALQIQKRVFEATPIIQSTLKNAFHGIFRQPPDLKDLVENSVPCLGVEIRGAGGYLVAWALAEAFGAEIIEKIETAAELWEYIPYFDPRIIAPPHNTSLLNLTRPSPSQVREFGEGKNNAAVPQRAGKAAFSPHAFKEGAKAFVDMFKANAGRANWDALKYSEDLLRKFTQSLGLKIQKQTQKQPEIVGGEDTMVTPQKEIKTGIQRWIDTEKLFPQGAVTVISGKKGSRKTKAVLGYLFGHKDVKVGYYSHAENFEDRFKRQQMAHKALDKGVFIDLDAFRDVENMVKQLEFEIKKHGLNVIYLDPPHTAITGKTNDEGMAGELIGGLQKLAKRLGIAIIVARNMNKKEYAEAEAKIAGSFVWYCKPQSAVFAREIEAGSQLRTFKENPKTILYQIATNVGPLAPNKPVCEGSLVDIKTDEGPDVEWILSKTGEKEIKGIKVEPLIESHAARAKSQKEEILEWFSTQTEKKALCREAKPALAQILRVSEGRVGNIIAKMDEIKTESKGRGRAGDNYWVLNPPTESKKKRAMGS